MRSIGVFGGAFNPPHLGHLRLARYFADKLYLARVRVIPSHLSVHKSSEDLAPAEDRLEMCRLLFSGDRFEVNDMEISRGGKSYTYDSLLEISRELPDHQIFLIMGSDMFESFHTWYRYEDILKMATVCTARRQEGLALEENPYGALIADLPPLEISSSMVRQAVEKGQDIEAYTGPKVAGYVKDRGLYLAKT
ncbi:MAG: nicotinate (nicotinamide) nucleotide adenylyltransferase [Clostridiales bacterium]|nr:nicotinate (nicotinamide) nucleotide adenylyltransferase [Clostridiales bacterium]